jgi:putative peptidoglycan lipid II flippase
VRVLYERGAFTAGDTRLVAEILAIFGIGLPAFVLIKAFTPGFFAREDTRTPMLFAAVSVAINITVALTLFPSMGAPGIATAAAISGWANAALLFGTLAWRGHWGSDRGLLLRVPRLILSAGLMAGALWYAADWLAASFAPDALFVVQAPALLMMVLGAMVIYFAAAFATGGADVGMLRRNVKRGERPLPPLE